MVFTSIDSEQNCVCSGDSVCNRNDYTFYFLYMLHNLDFPATYISILGMNEITCFLTVFSWS